MSKKLTVYQTLKNKDNADYVESHGPFICNWTNAWLGEGYYFWEAFIDHAHWWGKARCNGNYFICESNCVKTETNCFDLVGDTDHMTIFSEAVDQMAKRGLKNAKTTVPRILHFLKFDSKVFHYDATRAVGFTSISEENSPEYIKKLLFEPIKSDKVAHYINYRPPIQICFYRKDSMELNGYKVIFPYEYMEGYVL